MTKNPVKDVGGRRLTYRLHKALPGSKLIITEKAGHVMSEKPTEKELIKAMKELENLEI